MPVQTNRLLLAIGLDLVLTAASLWLATQLRLLLPWGNPLSERNVSLSAPVYALALAIWALTLGQFNLYTQRRARFRDESRALTFAVVTALLLFAGALYLSFRQVSRLQFLYFGAINWALLHLAHGWRHWRRARGIGCANWRVLIVGAGKVGQALAARLRAHGTAGIVVTGFLDDDLPPGSDLEGLPVLGRINELTQVCSAQGIAEVVLALPRDAYGRLLDIVNEAEALPVQVSITPDVLDLAWFMTRVEDVGGIPLLRLRESPLNGPLRVIKRLMDLVAASALLILLAPLMVVIAIAIKLDSPGPALICQARAGEGGRLFGMYKFRTMWAGEETKTPTLPPDALLPAHKRRDDPRVTRLGRFLRRYSLDELPQLFNVLKGEMSLVGPRPELPWLVERYQGWQRRRFAVPPGMTGWWQINGRSERPMHLHVEDDLYYIRNYSLWLDMWILLRTVPVVLSGRGAF